MEKKIRWGVLGCGNIAAKFSADLQHVPDALLLAVASRNKTVAADFAARFAVTRSYGSYSDLVNDPDIDVIYVATPHGLHHEHVLQCLEKKKAVLCEKAFAINQRQAEE